MWILVILGIIAYVIYRIATSSERKVNRPKINPDIHTLATAAAEQPEETEKFSGEINETVSAGFLHELSEHRKTVESISHDGNLVKKEREKFDLQIGFSSGLWQFYDDVKHYKSWYARQKDENGSPHWRSEIIRPEELNHNKLSLSSLKKFTDDRDFNKDDNILEFKFSESNNNYFLYINESSKYYSSILDEPSNYYWAFVIENDKNVVYKARLFFAQEYNDYYDRSELQAFKPDLWTGHLLNIILGVRFEEELHSKKFWKKFNEEREQENKQNFL